MFYGIRFFTIVTRRQSKKNGETLILPQVRRWLNHYFAIVTCPYCKKHHPAIHKLFWNYT
jgi:hypothetical protein